MMVKVLGIQMQFPLTGFNLTQPWICVLRGLNQGIEDLFYHFPFKPIKISNPICNGKTRHKVLGNLGARSD